MFGVSTGGSSTVNTVCAPYINTQQISFAGGYSMGNTMQGSCYSHSTASSKGGDTSQSMSIPLPAGILLDLSMFVEEP